MKIKDQFVSYEIALKLKELGFNEECLLINIGNDLFMGTGYPKSNFKYEFKNLNKPFTPLYEINIPLWQQVIDWFRIKYSIHIHINDSFLVSTNSPQYKDMIYYYDYTVGCKSNTKFGDFEADYNKIREVAVLKAIKMIEDGSVNKGFK